MKILSAPLEMFLAVRQAEEHVEAGVPSIPYNTAAIYGASLCQNEA